MPRPSLSATSQVRAAQICTVVAPAAPQCRTLHAWLLADRAELEGSNRPLQVPKSGAGKVALLLFEGGTKWDAFLIAASAQV